MSVERRFYRLHNRITDIATSPSVLENKGIA